MALIGSNIEAAEYAIALAAVAAGDEVLTECLQVASVKLLASWVKSCQQDINFLVVIDCYN